MAPPKRTFWVWGMLPALLWLSHSPVDMHHPLPNSCTRFQVPDPNGSTTPDYKHLQSAPALKPLKRRGDSFACPPALCSPSFLSFILVCSQMKLFLSPAEQRNRLSAALLKWRIPKGEGGRQRPTSCSVWGKPPGQRSQQLPCCKAEEEMGPKQEHELHPPPLGGGQPLRSGASPPPEWREGEPWRTTLLFTSFPNTQILSHSPLGQWSCASTPGQATHPILDVEPAGT